MKKNIPKTLVLTLFGLFVLELAVAQDLTNNFKQWYGINLNTKLSSKLKLKAGALLAENTSPSNFSFAQGKLGLSYKVKKKMYAEIGYVKQLLSDSQSLRNRYNLSPGLFNKLEFDRVYGNISYKQDIVKRLSLKHEIEIQFFTPTIQKYKSRYIYSGKFAYNLRKTSLSPYIENQIYYYAGGEISSGIKRYRLKAGLQFKPLKDFPLSTSLYYLFQNEFNTEFLSENDYRAIGLSLSFSI